MTDESRSAEDRHECSACGSLRADLFCAGCVNRLRRESAPTTIDDDDCQANSPWPPPEPTEEEKANVAKLREMVAELNAPYRMAPVVTPIAVGPVRSPLEVMTSPPKFQPPLRDCPHEPKHVTWEACAAAKAGPNASPASPENLERARIFWRLWRATPLAECRDSACDVMLAELLDQVQDIAVREGERREAAATGPSSCEAEEERAADLDAELWLANQRIEHLENALKWFADEGHYTETYRRGAGFVDAVGLTHARAGLLGMDADDADAVDGTWSVSHYGQATRFTSPAPKEKP